MYCIYLNARSSMVGWQFCIPYPSFCHSCSIFFILKKYSKEAFPTVPLLHHMCLTVLCDMIWYHWFHINMTFNQDIFRYILVIWFFLFFYLHLNCVCFHQNDSFSCFLISLSIHHFLFFLVTIFFPSSSFFSYLVLSCLISPYLILSYLTLSQLTLPYTFSKISHDVHSYVIGLGVCILAHTIFQFIHKDLLSNKAYLSKITLTAKWIAIAVKTVVLGTVWLTIPPFIIGETHTHFILFYVLFILVTTTSTTLMIVPVTTWQ